jgi:hypothetical protein
MALGCLNSDQFSFFKTLPGIGQILALTIMLEIVKDRKEYYGQ